MLKRSNKLNLAGIRKYLKYIVSQFVEKPGKVRISSEEFNRLIKYHLSVHEDDIDKLEQYDITWKSLNHIAKKVTRANLDKDAQLDSEFGITQ